MGTLPTLTWVLGGVSCVLAAVVVMQARKIRRLRAANAERAEQALLGRVRISGRDFPLPSAAWKLEEVSINGKDTHVLRHGAAVVDHADVFVVTRASQSPALTRTSATAAYVAEVWRCYHNRILQESDDK